MNKSIGFFLFLIICILPSGHLYAQTTADRNAKGKIIKWEPLSGKDNEVIFYLPQGFETATDGDYYLEKGGSSRVDKKLVVARYVNGVVLMTEYYEGDAKGIKKFFQGNEKISAGKKEEINGFEFEDFSGKIDRYFYRTQYFKIKNRLYIVKAIAKSEDNKIVRDFFSAVKLINGDKAVLPNVAKDVSELSLANIVEAENSSSGAENAIDSKDADRKALILYLPKPRFPRNAFGGRSSGQVRLKVLFSATGQISNVEVLESPSKEIAAAAVESIKKAKFLPAEKDGKAVSVYQIQSYGFNTETRITVL